MSEAKRPLESFSVGPFSVAQWENEVEGSDRTYKTVTLRKSYREDGEWRAQTVSVKPQEIGCIIGLLQKMAEVVINGTTPY